MLYGGPGGIGMEECYYTVMTLLNILHSYIVIILL